MEVLVWQATNLFCLPACLPACLPVYLVGWWIDGGLEVVVGDELFLGSAEARSFGRENLKDCGCGERSCTVAHTFAGLFDRALEEVAGELVREWVLGRTSCGER
jgi:hypothetical protein